MFRRAVVKTVSICHDSFSTEQILDRGPYRKKPDRLGARDYPIRFKDLGFLPAKMLQKKYIYFRETE